MNFDASMNYVSGGFKEVVAAGLAWRQRLILAMVLHLMVLGYPASHILAMQDAERHANGRAPVAINQTAKVDIVIPDDAELVVEPPAAKPLPIEFSEPQASDYETASMLASYLEKSTGAKFQVRKESEPAVAAGAIHIGKTKYAQVVLAGENQAGDLDGDGYVLFVADEKNIVILGGSELGTEYGAYSLLEQFVGVRWLFPGELGEHVPVHSELQLPLGMYRDEPRFLSRYFRPYQVEGGMQWVRRNRAHLRIEFHHNIPKLFDAHYAKRNPDLFPMIDGQRYLPPRTNIPTWHLCYSADQLVEKSVDLISNFFAKYPQYSSLSLGISDAGEDRYCACDKCTARYPDRENSLGYADRSDIYYRWCNKVIEGVGEKYPDKRYGCIAYREVTDPPSNIHINEKLIPFLCFDRMLWADSARQEQDRQLTRNWAAVAEELGWYDYIYGDAYIVPRVYPQLMQKYLQFAYNNKVRHYYAEANPSKDWHEGPKYYIALKLLWNPDANVNELLEDWCKRAVGPEAAPYLISYYSFWEEFWTTKATKTEWFSDRSKIYLIFNARGYLDALTLDDIEQCTQWLAQAEAAAVSDKQKKRASYIKQGFEHRRQTVLNYYAQNNALQAIEDRLKVVDKVIGLDFGQKASGWEPFSSENKGTSAWDSHVGKKAPGSLRIDNRTSVIHRGIPVLPGKTYRISGWYGISQPADDSRLELKLEWRDQQKDEFKNHHLSKVLPIASKPGWRSFTMVCTPPEMPRKSGRYLGISFSVLGVPTGSVWVDDLAVEEVRDASR